MLSAGPRNEAIKSVDAAFRLFGPGSATPPPTRRAASENYSCLRKVRSRIDFGVRQSHKPLFKSEPFYLTAGTSLNEFFNFPEARARRAGWGERREAYGRDRWGGPGIWQGFQEDFDALRVHLII